MSYIYFMRLSIGIFAFLLYGNVYSQIEYGVGFCSQAVLMPISLDDTSTQYVLIDTNNTGTRWVIGQPVKSIFTSANTLPRALVTDSVLPYSMSTNTSFQLKLSRCLGNSDVIILAFNHRFESDTLQDGGTIELSFDNGLTYGNLMDSSFLQTYNISYYYPPPMDNVCI